MESCDFGQYTAKRDDEAFSVLDKYLPQLIPLLVNKMTYSEEELMDLPVDNIADAHVYFFIVVTRTYYLHSSSSFMQFRLTNFLHCRFKTGAEDIAPNMKKKFR